MSQAKYHPLEAILRFCAQAAPGPWYYQVFAQQSGIDPERLLDLLELLWLEGLVQKAQSSPQTGPGITLTERGKQVVEDPEAMRRLVAGEAVLPGDIGSTIRQSLRQRTRPVLTKAIIAANVAVFSVGALLASRTPGLLSEYLLGFLTGRGHTLAWVNLLEKMGILTAPDLLRGQWWRLMTTAFLHDGVLHIGMNMYALWILGRSVEQTLGRWRYLAVYLLSAWGGSCLAMTFAPGTAMLGASGAVCGILGVEAVWILLYGRYLPQRMASRGRGAMLTNIVLIVFISLIPGVSWQGHLGGGLAGAAAALVLHFQRFGGPVLRVLGVLALPLMAWGSFAYMQHTLATSKVGLAVELHTFESELIPPINTTTREARKVYIEKALPQLDRHATRRDEGETRDALEVLEANIAKLQALAGRLQKAGPYHDKEVEKARTTALEYVSALTEAMEDTVRCLRAGKEWKKADEEELQKKWDKAEKQRAAWRELLS
jgi:membrane associated rhomboid family serine protease